MLAAKAIREVYLWVRKSGDVLSAMLVQRVAGEGDNCSHYGHKYYAVPH